jgi:hypothetical protein
MADLELQQANHLTGSSFSRSALPQRQNRVLRDTEVSLIVIIPFFWQVLIYLCVMLF